MLEIIFTNPWYWITGVILGLLVLVALAGIPLWRSTDYDVEFGGQMMTILGGFGAFVLAGCYFGLILPPYDTSFYHTYRMTGELTTVEAAFSGDEGTMSQVFILEVEGIDYPIKSEDQRFRLMNVGDEVDLVCGKSFAYFQEPWFDCTVRQMVR